MLKITLLYVMVAVCYIQYIHANDATSILITNDLPSINFTELDNFSKDKTRFITTANISDITVDGSGDKHDDVDGYYKWLSFLKSSTPAHTANATKHSNTTSANEKN